MKKYNHLIPFIALGLFTGGIFFLGSTPDVQLSPGDPISLIIPLPAIAIVSTLTLFIITLVRKNAK